MSPVPEVGEYEDTNEGFDVILQTAFDTMVNALVPELEFNTKGSGENRIYGLASGFAAWVMVTLDVYVLLYVNTKVSETWYFLVLAGYVRVMSALPVPAVCDNDTMEDAELTYQAQSAEMVRFVVPPL